MIVNLFYKYRPILRFQKCHIYRCSSPISPKSHCFGISVQESIVSPPTIGSGIGLCPFQTILPDLSVVQMVKFEIEHNIWSGFTLSLQRFLVAHVLRRFVNGINIFVEKCGNFDCYGCRIFAYFEWTVGIQFSCVVASKNTVYEWIFFWSVLRYHNSRNWVIMVLWNLKRFFL